MNRLVRNIFVTFVAVALAVSAFAVPKIAIVGDSISQGIGIPEEQRAEFCYPAQLAKILGDSCVIKNCSLRGSNIVAKGFRPYMKQKCYKEALDFKPDVIIILLGTNDGHSRNWAFKNDFEKDYNALLDSFSSLESKPRIIVGLPIPCFSYGNPKRTDGNVLRKEVTPKIEKVAKERNLEVIDFYPIFENRASLLPDTIHPNKEGAKVLAEFLADWLVKNKIVKK